MRIAVYGTDVKQDYLSIYQRIFNFFSEHSIEMVIHSRIKEILHKEYEVFLDGSKEFNEAVTPDDGVDFILSIGGDGTFLNAIGYALLLNIPIAGINCGRLGFLADITSDTLEEALGQLISNDFKIEYRTLLEITEPKGLFQETPYAANEITVQKLDNSSMIRIDSYINGEFLASYWADGLIVATPTGSTAYSLSVGGPIVTPGLEGIIITPIASHNLTVRPVVVPDHVEIELKIGGRANQFMVSVDHHSVPLNFDQTVKLRKANVSVPVVKLNGSSFYTTLRNKLMWGADKRN